MAPEDFFRPLATWDSVLRASSFLQPLVLHEGFTVVALLLIALALVQAQVWQVFPAHADPHAARLRAVTETWRALLLPSMALVCQMVVQLSSPWPDVAALVTLLACYALSAAVVSTAMITIRRATARRQPSPPTRPG